MIELIDFLKAAGVGVSLRKLKIHLASWNGHEKPINVYYEGNFKAWQEWQNRRNFACAQIVSLIDLGQHDWLFAGVYQINDCKPHPNCPAEYLYSTSLIPHQEELVGRVIVHHQRSGRASYLWHKPEISLPVAEIRREKLTFGEFPGYNAVILSHRELKIVIGQKIESWHGALANVKGVYLITDTSTGKHYVGKASGTEGIWQRWCSYTENGHGKNEGLIELLKEKGDDHASHFQYSILEIADTHASDAYILKRELYWMNVLKTGDFGFNKGAAHHGH